VGPPPCARDIFTIAADPRKVFLGLGAVRFPVRPAEAAARFAPGTPTRDRSDYVVCIVGGRHEHFLDLSGADLRAVAAGALADWPDGAAAIVRAGEPDSFFPVEMRTSVPFALDAPTNVTVLGDAVHAMTPTLGRGAHVAMRDGVLLGRALQEVSDGRSALADGLAADERDMLANGFAVVREAARIGEQRMVQNPFPEAIAR
jgi:2-polyprenyl-6-methoxyphenol hydroxylase-like FAD-dependent oxidoreductase